MKTKSWAEACNSKRPHSGWDGALAWRPLSAAAGQALCRQEARVPALPRPGAKAPEAAAPGRSSSQDWAIPPESLKPTPRSQLSWSVSGQFSPSSKREFHKWVSSGDPGMGSLVSQGVEFAPLAVGAPDDSVFLCQEDVSYHPGVIFGRGCGGQVHSPDGHRPCGQQEVPLCLPPVLLAGGWQGGPTAASQVCASTFSP